MQANLLQMESLAMASEQVLRRHRWIIHLIFWGGITLLYVVVFGRRNSNYSQTLFFVALLMPVTIATTYFLNYYLLPRYLMRGRYGFFLLYFIYTLTGALFLEMMIAVITFIALAKVNIRDMSPESVDIIFLLTSLLVVVLFGVSIKLLLHWRASTEAHQKLMSDKIAAELKFLKGQLNPHFIFNTLNNLYYLTTEKSDRAPQAVLQLSEMLDYVMHSGKEVFVPLTCELKQVHNYIALEMLRYEDRVKVNVTTTGDTSSQSIGPMLVVTLIENAFKHGVMSSARQSWIDVAIRCDEKGVDIVVRNSAGKKIHGQGIGLDNLKSQLSYLYSGKHQLNVSQDNESFQAHLILSR